MTIFGTELVLDLEDCALEVISDGTALRVFARELVGLLGMRAYGECQIDHFGHADPLTSGYTLVQRIETSLISAHFGERDRLARVNIFSCRAFDQDKAAEYCEDFLGGRISRGWLLHR